jgi:HlyD family secretion protein
MKIYFIFAYEGEIDPTIKLLNLEIKTGSTIAIVGASGSGKSTVLDLILGILEPQNGEVEISGQHPRTAISRWPGSIGYVPQQVAVFNKSMLENIAIGVERSEINSKQIEKCLSMADLEAMVLGLDQGLDTILQESGNNISGGQKQRIGIARALYNDPKILILDESTSSLDVQTEKIIIEEVRLFKNKKTVIIISHRLSSLKYCDSIYKLNSLGLKKIRAQEK